MHFVCWNINTKNNNTLRQHNSSLFLLSSTPPIHLAPLNTHKSLSRQCLNPSPIWLGKRLDALQYKAEYRLAFDSLLSEYPLELDGKLSDSLDDEEERRRKATKKPANQHAETAQLEAEKAEKAE